MVSVSGALTSSMSGGKVLKLKKSLGAGALMTGFLSIMDFQSVPGAFKLDYDTKGEKVEGTNWKSGLKELGKSALRCASYIAVPAAIAALPAILGIGGVAMATLAGIAAFGSSSALFKLFDKILPEEQKLVAEACKAKGIKPNSMGEYLA